MVDLPGLGVDKESDARLTLAFLHQLDGAFMFQSGHQVKAGAVLATLDTSLVAPQVTSLQASLEEARANAAVSRAEFRRAQAVAAVGALSAQETERREAAAR